MPNLHQFFPGMKKKKKRKKCGISCYDIGTTSTPKSVNEITKQNIKDQS